MRAATSFLLPLLILLMLTGMALAQKQDGVFRERIALASLLTQKPTDSNSDSWLTGDKLEHVIVSAMITGLGFFTAREHFGRSQETSLLIGSGIAVSAGVGKEYYDSRRKKGNASVKDLVADVVGVGLAILLIKTA